MQIQCWKFSHVKVTQVNVYKCARSLASAGRHGDTSHTNEFVLPFVEHPIRRKVADLGTTTRTYSVTINFASTGIPNINLLQIVHGMTGGASGHEWIHGTQIQIQVQERNVSNGCSARGQTIVRSLQVNLFALYHERILGKAFCFKHKHKKTVNKQKQSFWTNARTESFLNSTLFFTRFLWLFHHFCSPRQHK